MDKLVIKRFIKYNKLLVAVVGLSLLLVLFLLVISVLEFIAMDEARTKVEVMRQKIMTIQSQSPAVVHDNLENLKKDYDFYLKLNAKIRPYIGHPYRKAVDEFGKALGFENGDKLVDDFYQYKDKRLAVNQYYRISDILISYRNEFRSRNKDMDVWANAMKVFIAEAQKVSPEKITAENQDQIFLQAVGFNSEIGSNDIFAVNKDTWVADFTAKGISAAGAFDSLLTSSSEDAVFNYEVISDMLSRIIKKAPIEKAAKSSTDTATAGAAQSRYIQSLDKIEFVGKYAYQHNPNITVYKYRIKMRASMPALRNIIFAFNEAIADSRIYVLRDLKLYQPLELDPAARLLGKSVEKSESNTTATEETVIKKDDSHKAVHLRRGYGDVLAGGDIFFNVDMEYDYMVLKLK